MSNNSNPYDLDGGQIRSILSEAVDRATVLDVIPEAHAVRVNPRGDNSPLVAPVVTPMYGSVTLPRKGSRVTLVYITDNVPICVGGIYLADGEEPPTAEDGDIILGNGTGSQIRIADDGHISIITDGDERVDVDNQSASVYLSDTQTIPSQSEPTKVEFNTVEEDREGLWDQDNHQMVVKADGLHKINTSVAILSAGQNNLYEISVFVNDTEVDKMYRQSATNEPLSLHASTSERLEAGDTVDVRVKNQSGSGRDIEGDSVTTEFDIRRTGI